MDILPIPNSGYLLSSRRQSLPSYSAGRGGDWVRGLRNDVSWSSNQKKKTEKKKKKPEQNALNHI